MTVLLVDVANVMGARPDGWWRDRPGAATRLLAQLAALPGLELTGPTGYPVLCTGVTAVVEGQARNVEAPPPVRVVRAPGSGDDTIVTCTSDLTAQGLPVLVVTADRALRGRLPSGTPVAGPRWLLDQLDGREAPT